MAIKSDDLILVHRGGQDYKAPAGDLAVHAQPGEKGAAGPAGPKGETGSKGEKGASEDLSGYAQLDGAVFTAAVTATEFIGDGSNLTNLPTPVLEGALVFKGTVDDEASLPDSGNSVGDLWQTTDDDSLYARGQDGAWHKVGNSTSINLSEYAKLDGNGAQLINYSKISAQNTANYIDNSGIFCGNITSSGKSDLANVDVSAALYGKTTGLISGFASATVDGDITTISGSFVGDGSKLTNLPSGGGDVELSGYAKLDGNPQGIINTSAFNTFNPGNYLNTSELRASNVNGGTICARDSIEIGSGYVDEDGRPENDDGGVFLYPSQITLINADSIELFHVTESTFNTTYGKSTLGVSEFGFNVNLEDDDGDSIRLAVGDYGISFSGEEAKHVASFDFPVTVDSSVTATEFIGDGSKLTGVLPYDISTLDPLP